ncbi:glycerophosphodiester phosphodiesterase GDPD1, chloroplastic-like isoform X1 [Corylus avellana]|uniref:glycerophosphodiester phosphodiesterase GDPD1, chloroplastic-like isoform X1 n=1 Tax=Corylus avellana TaxID=13451 RepID=UPI001E23B769|nr:glycerophosphodiester phosphodiesterase GDPD1, chloroplastic-like isoform X1 [Corylus avellana]
MALKAVHVSDVPNLDQFADNAELALSSTQFFKGVNDHGGEEGKCGYEFSKFTVMGHRGCGMNMVQSSVPRMEFLKENSILSFNAAAKLPIDFIEFDVQVTEDGCPVIFHDGFILTQDKGAIVEKRVTDLTVAEFLSYGPQKQLGSVGKPLFRRTKDGNIFEWKVENDDPLCTLQEAFEKVENSIGFNIELKLDDQVAYTEEQLTRVLQAILQVVNECANNRPIIFSSFQPDAALLIRKLQTTYPVFFLTNGGSKIYIDIRRNSLDEAIKVCLTGGLQGIVSELRAIFRNPGAVTRIKDSKLSLVTYGQLNNFPEVVYVQHRMGVDGVIVDLVEEVTEAISDWIRLAEDRGEEGQKQVKTNPGFLQQQLSLPLLLPPELLHT